MRTVRQENKAREVRARRALEGAGFRLVKSGKRITSPIDQGEYSICDQNGRHLMGFRFELSLDEVEAFLLTLREKGEVRFGRRIGAQADAELVA
jgi:hypothetical protein